MTAKTLKTGFGPSADGIAMHIELLGKLFPAFSFDVSPYHDGSVFLGFGGEYLLDRDAQVGVLGCLLRSKRIGQQVGKLFFGCVDISLDLPLAHEIHGSPLYQPIQELSWVRLLEPVELFVDVHPDDRLQIICVRR